MKRYRLKTATWSVVGEATDPHPRRLNKPEAVVDLVRDLVREHDDDRERL